MPTYQHHKDHPPLFVANTSPEDLFAAGGEPTKCKHHVPILSVVLGDVAKKTLVTPNAYAKNGMVLTFPMLKPSTGGGLVEIKYLNKWSKKSGTGNRSVATKRDYGGYAGKQLTLIAVFDDIQPLDEEFPYYTYQVIELLRLWAITEVTQQIGPTAYKIARLQIRKAVSPEEREKIKQSYMDSFGPGGSDAFKKEHGAYTRSNSWTVINGFPKPFDMAPLPPAPLRFQFGNLILPCCVLKQADLTITRYDGQRATAAEAKIVLQEVTEHALWSSESPNPQQLMALTVGVNPPDSEVASQDWHASRGYAFYGRRP